MMVADTMIDHMAHTLGVEPEEIRKKNLFQFNDTTAYNMPVNVKLKVLSFSPPPRARENSTDRVKTGNMGAL